MPHTATHLSPVIQPQQVQGQQLTAGATTPIQSNPALQNMNLMQSLISQPTLPAGAPIVAIPQQIGTGTAMATSGVGTTAPTATGQTAAAPTAITAPTTPTATQVATTPYQQTADTYTAALVGQTPVPQVTAAQGTVTQPMTAQTGAITADATVQGQLAQMTADVGAGIAGGATQMPTWARGAARLTEAAMAQRGMGQSSMMAEALAQGIMTSATPIAAADAQTYKEMIFQNLSNRQQATLLNAQNYMQMDMANLSNNQQSNMANVQLRQQTMLSDNAASNAALQFNAQSTQQSDQFFAGLASQIDVQNAQRSDAMNQFNVAEVDKINALNVGNDLAVDEANSNRLNAIEQFNASLKDARERFNVENQRVIDQSNVTWRRNINTANTALENAANQTNAQNSLNLSNYALSSLWQQWRDEATWTNQAAENTLTRNFNMALGALERSVAFEMMDAESKQSMYEMLGAFGFEIIKQNI